MQQATSNHIRQQQEPRTSTDAIKERCTTKAKKRKASARAKESTTKAKPMGAMGTTTTTTTTKEKASGTMRRLDKHIHSKDNKDAAKEKDDANDNTNDWYSQVAPGSNTGATTRTTPRPADSSAAPVSGLQEVKVAMIGTAQQLTEDNKWVSLMIDSGAATHMPTMVRDTAPTTAT